MRKFKVVTNDLPTGLRMQKLCYIICHYQSISKAIQLPLLQKASSRKHFTCRRGSQKASKKTGWSCHHKGHQIGRKFTGSCQEPESLCSSQAKGESLKLHVSFPILAMLHQKRHLSTSMGETMKYMAYGDCLMPVQNRQIRLRLF